MRYTRKAVLWALAGIALALAYGFLVMAPDSNCYRSVLPEGAGTPGMNFTGYDYSTLLHFMQAITSDAGALECYYSQIGIWDMIFPFVYGTMYFLLFLLLFRWRMPAGGINPLFYLLALPLVMDWAENLQQVSMVKEYAAGWLPCAADAALGSALTISKWGLQFLTGAAILFGAGLYLYQRSPRS